MVNQLESGTSERNLKMLSINDENKIDFNFSFLDFKHKATDKEIDDEVYMHRHRSNIPPVNRISIDLNKLLISIFGIDNV